MLGLFALSGVFFTLGLLAILTGKYTVPLKRGGAIPSKPITGLRAEILGGVQIATSLIVWIFLGLSLLGFPIPMMSILIGYGVVILLVMVAALIMGALS